MPVKGSDSYVWFTEQNLGARVGSQTYFGRNKLTGLPCVVKLLKDNSLSKVDKFKKLNHLNVAKFLGMEQTKHKETVVVFEYCDELCLPKFLEKPANVYGLNDRNSINLLEDVINGLQFLRDIGLTKNFYIKPSNILCAREIDGNITFKISDYLYNEYEVQTDIYWINIVQKKVDALIWSIGAILCHAILGTCPFITGVCIDTEKMILEKGNDHIFVSTSGQWQNSFPKTVQLTLLMQTLFTTIIKGCLNLQKQIDLKKFFAFKLRLTTSDSIIYAFDPRSLSHIALICRKDSITCLDNSVPKHELVVFDHKVIAIKELHAFGNRISEEEPAIFCVTEIEPKMLEYKEILECAYADVKRKIGDDIPFARSCNGFIIYCLRLFEKILLTKKGLKQICITLADESSIKMSMIKLKLDVLKSFDQHACQEPMVKFEILKNEIYKLQMFGSSDECNDYASCSDSGLGQSCEPPQDSGFDALMECHCHGILKELAEGASKTYDQFLQDVDRQLTHNETQVHKYEKAKLKQNAKKAHHLLVQQIQKSSDIISRFNEVIKVHSKCDTQVLNNFDEDIEKSITSGCEGSSGYCSIESTSIDWNQHLALINKSIGDVDSLFRELDDVLYKKFVT